MIQSLAALALPLALSCLIALSGCDLFLSADQRIERAEQRAAEGDSRAAVIELQNALESEPTNLRARLMLVDLSLVMGDPKLADKELARAIADGATTEQTARRAAEIRLASGEFTELLSQLESGKIVLSEPQQSTYRGLALLGTDQVEAALQAFEKAVAADAGAARARLGMAQAHIRLGKSEAALKALDQALAVDPKNADALLLRGTILAQRGEFREAVQAYDAARQQAAGKLTPLKYNTLLAAQAEAQLASGDLEAAQATQGELKKRSNDAPLSHLIAARIAMAQQNYPQAVAEAQRVVAKVPQHPQAKLLLGAALLANGSFNQAEAELSELVQQSPQNLEARKLLAQTNLRLQRPDVAMQVLSPAQQADAADPQVDVLLGWANLQRGEESTAIELLERSVAAQPDNEGLKLDLALAYLGGGQNDKAIELLRSLPDKASNLRRDNLLIAAVAAGKGTAAARSEVQRMVAAHPQDAGVLNIAAMFHAQQRDFDQARRYLQRAIDQEPKNVSSLMALARVEVADGHDAAAKAALDKVLEVEPSSAIARVALAQIAVRGGDKAAAVKRLEEVRHADANAIEPRLLLALLYLQDKQAAAADEVIRETLQAGKEKAAVTAAVGQLYLGAGRYGEALARFREAASQAPRDPQRLLDVARAQIALGSLSAARESIEKARALQPDMIAAGAMLVSLELRQGHRDQALAEIAALKKAHPRQAVVDLLEGDVAMSLRSPAKAAAAYAAAYHSTPSATAAVKAYRARVLAKVASPAALMENWLTRQPEDFAVRMIFAEALSASGQRQRAIEQYELAAKERPNAVVLNNLAWQYFEARDPRAEATAKQAYDLSPESGAVADTYAWILVETGKVAEGLTILEQTVKDSDAAAEIRYHYAVALARAGQRDKARDELRKLTRSEDSFASAAQARQLLSELGG